MKFSNSVAMTLATAGSLAAAHGHGHQHFHNKRATETNTIAVPGPVVYDFVVLDPSKPSASPKPISNHDACDGLDEHKLEWLGTPVPAACPHTSTSTSTKTPTKTPTIAPPVLQETSAAVTPSSSSTSTPTPPPPAPPTTSSTTTSVSTPASTSSTSSGGSGSGSGGSGAEGVDREFPDGTIDCEDFPSDYGPVALDYLGLGGYSGVQFVQFDNDVINDIVTAVSGKRCGDGSMCSYACPAGYQKSQWPSTQGSTGQSVGGLQCKNGKLYLTNKDHKKLCIPGVGGVHVRNKLNKHVAVCRTDYPGTEAETIPLYALAGQTHPLTCPDGDTYFFWEKKTTSAQYYVNPAGVSQEEGCQWGDGSKPVGNWAPMNLGVGYTKNGKFLSMFQNSPTTDKLLPQNVRLVGDDLTDQCKYENGKFYNKDGEIKGANGCTAGVTSGDAIFEFY
ncbi:hypothetical protein NUU61_002403 [Penicillium alfredii]|uniref:SUN n=1 Tax=Penicillium alfredii TaxID=1506179 RepID=A0A9W9FRG7_9EURO|nr:uncharacterized protein NUU61_002403 [Penicillium alfredii]KAJ5105056.1 hypothetical protein NUU61_002403 [Penicillium alfredii]